MIKKILIVEKSIDKLGGVERIVNTLANAFSLKDNYEVNVLSEVRSYNEPFYKYNENIKIKYLVDESKSFTNYSSSKNLKYYLARIVDKTKEILLLKTKRNLIKKQFELNDVIIFGRIETALDFLPLIKNKENKKIIVRDAIHLEYYDKKAREKILNQFPNKVDTFIISSDESKKIYQEFFKDYNLNVQKIYNPLGIDPNVKYDWDAKSIVFTGRLDGQKGLDNLILAFEKVVKEYPDWNLNVYGDGPWKDKITNMINDHKLNNNVFIHKKVKNIVEVLNKASIYVMTSRFEGYANSLVESLACGVPSISYDWMMGVQDDYNGKIVYLKNRQDYYNGVVSDEDISNLAKGIIEMIKNPKKCETYSKNAAKIIETRKKEDIIEKWENIINS